MDVAATERAETAGWSPERSASSPWCSMPLAKSDRGDWEAVVSELAQESPELHDAFLGGWPSFRFPGGESLAEQRPARARRSRDRRWSAAGLVARTAGTIRAALADSGARATEYRLAHGALVELELSS